MSLNETQRRATASEMQGNLKLSGLSTEDAADHLNWTPERLTKTLTVGPGAHPADVWALGDFLHQAVLAKGSEPEPYTVLTQGARAAARAWFGIER